MSKPRSAETGKPEVHADKIGIKAQGAKPFSKQCQRGTVVPGQVSCHHKQHVGVHKLEEKIQKRVAECLGHEHLHHRQGATCQRV